MSVVFENRGELDPRAIATFGCSVKVTDNPIGFFGTGLKYALAVLLRGGYPVAIQSGLKTYTPSVRPGTLRGKEFGFVHLDDGTPMGFTTELGKTWEPWMAYRELHCNAHDEPDASVYISQSVPPPARERTRIIVSGEFERTHDERDKFLLRTEPLFRFGSVEVHAQPSNGVFYKGIKIMNLDRPSLHTYNLVGHVDLTEDRTAKEPQHVLYDIAKAILEHADRKFLEQVLVAEEKQFEFTLDYHGWSVTPGVDIFPSVKELQRHSLTRINRTALRLWREKGQGFLEPRRITPTRVQSATLERAISFCERSGFLLRDEYPIFIVETLGEEGSMAIADRVGKQIFLTERLFQSGGTKRVARALIEEYLHLKFNFDDCSRTMQNYLFDKVVSQAEELSGEPL